MFFAAATTHAADHCEFRLGFKTLRDLIGHDIVGECLENEHYNEISDSNQQSTGGLMAWRKADNWTAFTDGYRTWINGPNGLVQRLNTERFPWEADYAPGGGIATPVPTATPQQTPLPVPTVRPTPQPVPTAQPQQVDPRLQEALDFIVTVPIGKYLVEYAHEQGVRFVFAPIPSRAGSDLSATFDHGSRTITVNSDFYRDAPVEVLAGILLHELAHVIPTPRFDDLDAEQRCLQRERQAEMRTAASWFQKYGREGSPLSHPYAQSLNYLASLWIGAFDNNSWAAFNEYVLSRFAEICRAKRPVATPTPTPRPTPTLSTEPGVFDPVAVRQLFRFPAAAATQALAEHYNLNINGVGIRMLLRAYTPYINGMPVNYLIHMWATGGPESGHPLLNVKQFVLAYLLNFNHYRQLTTQWLENIAANPCGVSAEEREWVIAWEAALMSAHNDLLVQRTVDAALRATC